MTEEILVPLESNPDVMNKFLQKVGVSEKWKIVDVVSLEPEMLTLIPQPVAAVILLFPVSDAYEQHKNKEDSDILAKGQNVTSNVFYMKQNVRNTCGTIALIHSVANNIDKIELNEEGHLKSFLTEAANLDSAAKGLLLKKCEGIIKAHEELAQEGQTNTPGATDPVDHHFISFVQVDGSLYELDGSLRSFPVNHGATTEETFLQDAAKICQKFMSHDPDEVRFTVLALVAND